MRLPSLVGTSGLAKVFESGKGSDIVGAQNVLTQRMLADEQKRQWDLQWGEYLKQMEANKATAGGQAGGLSSLVNEYNRSFAESKAAEDARYKQMLGLTDQTTGQRAADIRSEYGGQRANIMQNLARLGMANTSVAPTMALGVEREQQSALNRLADQMLGTKLGVMQGKQERYPTTDIIQTVAQLLGQQTQPQYGSGPIPLRAPGSGYGAGGAIGALSGLKM